MRGMPPLHEPILRYPQKRGTRKVVNGEAFDAQVGHDRSNVEAILAYSVGKKMPLSTECHSCARGSGKFIGYVLSPGQKYCASCHWRGMEKRCSFNAAASKAPETTKASTTSPKKRQPGYRRAQKSNKEVQAGPQSVEEGHKVGGKDAEDAEKMREGGKDAFQEVARSIVMVCSQRERTPRQFSINLGAVQMSIE